jgi:hypothetical protein
MQALRSEFAMNLLIQSGVLRALRANVVDVVLGLKARGVDPTV